MSIPPKFAQVNTLDDVIDVIKRTTAEMPAMTGYRTPEWMINDLKRYKDLAEEYCVPLFPVQTSEHELIKVDDKFLYGPCVCIEFRITVDDPGAQITISAICSPHSTYVDTYIVDIVQDGGNQRCCSMCNLGHMQMFILKQFTTRDGWIKFPPVTCVEWIMYHDTKWKLLV